MPITLGFLSVAVTHDLSIGYFFVTQKYGPFYTNCYYDVKIQWEPSVNKG